MSLKESIKKLNDEIANNGIEPEIALGSDLFLFASSLIPLVNVDLLVFNQKRQILLSWRDDMWSGIGWHFPGSCIRLRETLKNAVKRCALEELKTEVTIKDEPIKTYEIIYYGNRVRLENQRERAHTIAFAFACFLPEGYQINNGKLKKDDPGYLQLFDNLPPDLLSVHDCYKSDWVEIKRRIFNGELEE